MKNPNRIFLLILLSFSVSFFAMIASINAQSTYYSRNATSGGNWKSTNSWTLNADGSGGPTISVPQRADHVVILNGHEIQITNTDDNGSSAVKPDDVSDPDGNIGPFSGSSTAVFYHTGDITIDAGGKLKATKSIMLEGSTSISGTLDTNKDVINLGRLDAYAGSTLNVGDDFILSGNSETNIDVASLSADDIYFDNTSAQLCGTGDLTVGDEITEFNSADAEYQICAGFEIHHSGGTLAGKGSFILPVELYSYNVKLKNNQVRIDWVTATEIDNEYFAVERSVDARHFEEIEIVEGAGNSNDFRYYSVTDRFPYEGKSYYRLKQVDFDGKTTYFDIKMVDNNEGYTDKHGLTVYPNPIMEHSRFTIGLDGFEGNTVQVKIQNMSGFLVYSDEVKISQERELLDLDTNIIQDSGMYVVSVFHNDRWYHHKFMYVK